jgi:protein gp37
MGKTNIEWCDAVWNPLVGCSIVSAGCTNCYAQAMAARLDKMGMARYQGLTRQVNGHAVWTGEVRLVNEMLQKPLSWKKPRHIFLNSMSDLFHEDVTVATIASIFNVITDARAVQHIFQTLTKRAERMFHVMTDELPNYVADHYAGDTPLSMALEIGWPPKNWWAGVSVESDRYTSRIDYLRQTPASVRFLSLEPLLGPLPHLNLEGIHWVIVGAESGPNRRPWKIAWLQSICRQCIEAQVPVFPKQGGHLRPGMQADIPDELWSLKQWPTVGGVS